MVLPSFSWMVLQLRLYLTVYIFCDFARVPFFCWELGWAQWLEVIDRKDEITNAVLVILYGNPFFSGTPRD